MVEMSEATTPLFAVSVPLGAADMTAVSDAARAATLAQNRAGATRLEAAHVLVQQFSRAAEAEAADAERREASPRPAYARLAPESRARDHLAA
ncbi:HNH endonuclease, partial [Dietzia sp. E1]|nr:HNH endonuclease [Dietzia sp. E1]